MINLNEQIEKRERHIESEGKKQTKSGKGGGKDSSLRHTIHDFFFLSHFFN
jgi:hypothetical protein